MFNLSEISIEQFWHNFCLDIDIQFHWSTMFLYYVHQNESSIRHLVEYLFIQLLMNIEMKIFHRHNSNDNNDSKMDMDMFLQTS